MVCENIILEDSILSFPCMVTPHLPKNESNCGVLLFASTNRVAQYHILSIYTPSADEIKDAPQQRYISFNNKKKTVKIFFKLEQKNFTCTASPVVAWQCRSLRDSLQRVFQPKHQWSLTYNDGDLKEEKDARLNDAKALSWFILYQVHEEDLSGKIKHSELQRHASPFGSNLKLRTGMDIVTRSYPFGPDVMEIFTDARSSGIISNLSMDDLFLTDARCLPGSEGGGIYTSYISASGKQDDCLIGLIVAPLCWKTQELVGMTVCCSIRGILQSLQNHTCNIQHLPTRNEVEGLLRHRGIVEVASTRRSEPTVVRVDSGGIWGSGVVVAAKMDGKMCEVIIVTCRHVIEKAVERDDENATVTFEKRKKRYKANIVFATDEKSAYDLAILKLTTGREISDTLISVKNWPNGEKQVAINYCRHVSEFITGAPVFIKGYSLFDTQSELDATVSRGVLSNIVYHCGVPVLIHSTCLVHKGSSGGGLICASSGALQGIIVNHVKDDDSGVSYPDINFSVSCNIFMPAVEKYLISDDPSVFGTLNCYDKEVTRIWSLEPQKYPEAAERIQSKL